MLGLFLFPPLLLLVTAIAILNMGQGQMLGLPVGQIGQICAVGLLIAAIVILLWRAYQNWRALRQLRQYPTLCLETLGIVAVAHILPETAMPFAAQIGFWKSQLMISQGLLDQLSPAQIEAVLAHEQAHVQYRDTFWFFWLGWLRQLTVWMPNTERLWQELLLLRELRADRWAAERVDGLLLAESLLQMAQAPLLNFDNGMDAGMIGASSSRLEERIEALLGEAELVQPADRAHLAWWLLLSFVPLLTTLAHR
jgi:Zn-dependent protease with chaperone function